MASPQDVLAYWFGDKTDPVEVDREKSDLWWTKRRSTDDDIRSRFGADVEQAAAGGLDHWGSEASGRLALVILLDQFSRNIYRGTPQSFASDHRALAHAKAGIELGHDLELPPIRRYFLYMPFMHAEDCDDQETCVAVFERLVQSVDPAHREFFRRQSEYAVAHRDIVARFGRFPHRNEILGRDTTPEEAEFLKKPGSSF